LRHDYSYALQGQLNTIENDRGEQLLFSYDDNGRVQSIDTPGNQQYQYEYDVLGNLIHVYYPDSSFMTYHYEDATFPYHLTGITDENGNRHTTYAYNSNGQAILSELAGGAERIEVLEYGNDVRVSNAAGKESVYHFENVGSGAAIQRHLVGIDGEASQNCAASNSTLSYDANGFQDLVKDAEGFYTDYDYDAQGRQIQRTEALKMFGDNLNSTPDTRVIETDWTTQGRVAEIRTGNLTTTFTYDNGRITTRTETDTTTHAEPYSTNGTSRTWTYSYSFHNVEETQLASRIIDGPGNDVNDQIEQYFNENGYLTQVVSRLDNTQSMTVNITAHNALGLPTSITDENGVITTLTYTARGWVDTRTVQTPQGSAITDYDYDNVGQVTKITLATGITINYDYDAAHRLTDIYTGTGERISYELDTFGNKNVVRVQNSSQVISRLQTQEFDDLGRLWKVFGTNNQVRQVNGYDKNGNLTSITNSKLKHIIQSFDGLNRLTSITDYQEGIVEFTYDTQDNLVAVKDQNNLTTYYTVDGFGRRIQTSSPDTGTTVYHYDLSNNLTLKTDARNVVTQYSYDAFNRQIQVSYPASPTENISYHYDDTSSGNKGMGRLTQITDSSGTTHYQYDSRGNVIQETRTIEAQSYTTQYSYDLANNLTQMIYPSGRIVSYSLDNTGRIRAINTQEDALAPMQTVVEDVTYLPFGPVNRLTYGNGVVRTLNHDQAHRLSSVDSSVFSRAYEYDAEDNIEQITDLLNSSKSQQFIYDDLSRLTQAQGRFGTIDYQYDAVGNRTYRSQLNDSNHKTENYTYASNSNQLQQVDIDSNGVLSQRTINYTQNGNIQQDQTSQKNLEMIYNQQNRLEEVKKDGSSLSIYVHNALGQRVIKVAASPVANQHFIYDLRGNLVAEHKYDGAPISEYIFMGGRVVATIESEGALQSSLTLQSKKAYVGNQFTLDGNASGGVGSSYRYRFRIKYSVGSNPWVVLQDWSPVSNVQFELPMGEGKYYVDLTVKDESGVGYSRNVERIWLYLPLSASLTMDKSEVVSGDQVTLTASANGGMSTKYRYKYRIKGESTSNSWVTVRDWDFSPSFIWDTQGLEGDYKIMLLAKSRKTKVRIKQGLTISAMGQ